MKGIKHTVLAAAALLALGLMTNVAAAQDYSAVNANGTLTLGGYGNFFIPGNLATCPTPPAPYTNSQVCSGTTNPGLHMVNQMYVQFMLPVKEAKKAHYPIAHRAWLLLEHKIVADHARRTDGLGRVLRPSEV